MILESEDVYALIGHAALLRAEGKSDMPDYFMGLAYRLAFVIGDKELQAHVVESQRVVNGPTA